MSEEHTGFRPVRPSLLDKNTIVLAGAAVLAHRNHQDMVTVLTSSGASSIPKRKQMNDIAGALRDLLLERMRSPLFRAELEEYFKNDPMLGDDGLVTLKRILYPTKTI